MPSQDKKGWRLQIRLHPELYGDEKEALEILEELRREDEALKKERPFSNERTLERKYVVDAIINNVNRELRDLQGDVEGMELLKIMRRMETTIEQKYQELIDKLGKLNLSGYVASDGRNAQDELNSILGNEAYTNLSQSMDIYEFDDDDDSDPWGEW